MKKDEIVVNQKVVDRWYPEKGTGVILEVLKSTIKISFIKGIEVWDYPHAKRFLEVVK